MADIEAWLSIVTVVKDDPVGFEATARSLGDGIDGIEWVVIDSSSDAERIQRRFEASTLAAAGQYAWVPPAGIYPAMNEGLARSSGRYVLFLNAGDRMHGLDSLVAVRDVISQQDPAWLYGQVRFAYADGTSVTPEPFDYAVEKRRHFRRGRFPAHQGTFAHAGTLRALGGFDTSYAIVADYAVFLRLTLVSDPIELTEIIAEFAVGGVSSNRWTAALREFHQARVQVFHLRGLARGADALNTLSQGMQMGMARMLRRV